MDSNNFLEYQVSAVDIEVRDPTACNTDTVKDHDTKLFLSYARQA
jgi:hypothetical protein